MFHDGDWGQRYECYSKVTAEQFGRAREQKLRAYMWRRAATRFRKLQHLLGAGSTPAAAPWTRTRAGERQFRSSGR